MFAVLGAIFSSLKIYLIIGVVVAALGLYAYVEHLRASAANAQATVHEQASVLAQNARAIQDLQAARKADANAAQQIAASTASLAGTLADIKDQINALPKPKTCNSLDPRDRAAIDGVRRILTPDHSNTGH